MLSTNKNACYYTVIQFGGQLMLFENCFDNEIFTKVFISEDIGETFNSGKRIMSNSCACHNFSVFNGHDGKLYGLGGQDSWKNDPEWFCNDFFETFRNRFGEEYQKDEKAAKNVLNKIYMLRSPLKHTKGIYLFSSNDGLYWKQERFEPVITIDNIHGSLDWKSSEFDSLVSCIFHNGYYYCYLRDNVDKNKRFIQYGRSVDLINWSQFGPMQIDYDSNYNYYFATLFKYKNSVYSLIPCYSTEHGCIKLYKSEDCKSWEHIKDLFDHKPVKINGKFKNTCHPVNGSFVKDGKLFVYIHENYFGHSKERKVTVEQYEL